MAALRFTTTRLSGLRAAGRIQELQHTTVAPLLERELGSDYARLFADFEVESSDVRAWYADASTPPFPIAALPEAEAEAVRQRLAIMVGRIGEFAARIAAESTQKANLARILTAATTFPMEDIWADGSQPIIVNWGFHRHDVEAGVPRPIRERIRAAQKLDASPVGIIGPGSPAASPPPKLSPPKPTRRRWFGWTMVLWIAFVLLVAASYDLLLPACGLVGPFGLARLDACSSRAGGANVFAEGAELQALVDGAELEAAHRRALCRAPRHADLRPETDPVDPQRAGL